MTEPGPLWKLEGFDRRLDEWDDREHPSIDVRMSVIAWIITRFDGPYGGRTKRERSEDNYWSAVVPKSGDDEGRMVVCCYWVEEQNKTLRCDSFATLSPPFL